MYLDHDELVRIVEQYVFCEKHRKLLLRRFYDGIAHERLAEEFDMSVSQVKKIIGHYKDLIIEVVGYHPENLYKE